MLTEIVHGSRVLKERLDFVFPKGTQGYEPFIMSKVIKTLCREMNMEIVYGPLQEHVLLSAYLKDQDFLLKFYVSEKYDDPPFYLCKGSADDLRDQVLLSGRLKDISDVVFFLSKTLLVSKRLWLLSEEEKHKPDRLIRIEDSPSGEMFFVLG